MDFKKCAKKYKIWALCKKISSWCANSWTFYKKASWNTIMGKIHAFITYNPHLGWKREPWKDDDQPDLLHGTWHQRQGAGDSFSFNLKEKATWCYILTLIQWSSTSVTGCRWSFVNTSRIENLMDHFFLFVYNRIFEALRATQCYVTFTECSNSL